MSTIGGGPPIPATKLSGSGLAFLIVSVIFTLFSTVAVVLRFLSRRLRHSVGWDDWASLAALIFAYGNMITAVVCATLGRTGYHTLGFNLQQLEIFFQTLLAYVLLLLSSVSMSKLSVLWFYARIFPVQHVRVQVIIFSMITIAFWLSSIFCFIFAVNPVRAQWKPWISHTNLDMKLLYEVFCGLDTALDFVILCLPQKLVWKLQISFRRKILLSFLLLVGSFTCVITIVRLIYIVRSNLFDFTYTLPTPGLWSSVEVNLSIICSCAPTFPSLFGHWHHKSQPGTSKKSLEGTGSSWPSSEDEGHHQASQTPVADEQKSPHISKVFNYPVHVRTDIDIEHVERDGVEEESFMSRW